MGARPLLLPLLEPAYLVLLIFVVVPCSFSQPRHTVSACSFTAYLADVEASATCTIAFCVELWVNLTALLAVSAVPPRQFEVFGYAVLVCLCLFFSHRTFPTHSPSVEYRLVLSYQALCSQDLPETLSLPQFRHRISTFVRIFSTARTLICRDKTVGILFW